MLGDHADGGQPVAGGGSAGAAPPSAAPPRARVAYPRVFTGAHLSQISFPLGGVGAGSIGLGGRGQLREWQIFNRPDPGTRSRPFGWTAARARRS